MGQAARTLSDFNDRNLVELIHLFKEGLSTALFGQVASCLQVSESQLAKIVSIPVSTLTRRKRSGKLNTVESERVYRMIRIYNRAKEVLGSDEAASRWMHTKIKALGWQTPLYYADTEIGAREVEAVLGRIDHGVFS
jgi:putative toxin-antitoxin system antitoxin component (TIGR02293 family)